jgi:hypothetical protein
MSKKLILISILSSLLLISSRHFFNADDFKGDESIRYLLNKPMDLGYLNLYPKLEFENLQFLCDDGRNGVVNCKTNERIKGIMMRALRYKNITDAVEDKYELPRNTLMTMLMQECHGINLLPNGSGDGGVGLIHMQPMLAHQFGLSTLNDCKDLVSYTHGRQINSLIKEYYTTPEQLLKYDDRFHPVLNIDAAGRMIKYYSELTMIGKNKWDSAFKRYAGKYNYSIYTKNLRYFKEYIEDPIFMEELKTSFEGINPLLTYHGEFLDYAKFMEINHQFNNNYDLEKYVSTPVGAIP